MQIEYVDRKGGWMKKHKTYILVCDFCGNEFTYRAGDSYHIARLHCGERECRRKLRDLKNNKQEKENYNQRLLEVKKEAIPLEKQRKYTRRKTRDTPLFLQKLLQKVNGKIIRIENSANLGEIVDEDEERYCVNKSGSLVWYQKKSVKI